MQRASGQSHSAGERESGQVEFRRIDASSYRRVPWNNGGGTTADIDVERDGERVSWRLSIADIECDGPFSDFTGFDRTIVPVAGRGFSLLLDGRVAFVADGPSAAFFFDGGIPATCRLADGPCRAFNVMTARESHRHEVLIASAAHGEIATLGGICYVVALLGDFVVTSGRAAPSVSIEAGDTVRVAGRETFTLASPLPGIALVVRIRSQAGPAEVA